jgi:hypothetical protein
MIFLHINSKSNNAQLFNKYVEEGKQIFILFYMEGCGPCNMTRPEWKKIENVMGNIKNKNVVIVDVDQEILEEIKYLQSNPAGYPTMRYISNKGKTSEDYNGERNIDAFVSWIKSKIANPKLKFRKMKKSRRKGKTKKSKSKTRKMRYKY